MHQRWALVLPSHTVPATRWRSNSRWRTGPGTFAILVVGLWLFGTGEAMLVASSLGNGPWTVLAQGLSTRLPMSIGLATFVISVVVLLLWIPLRERPGLGTISNAVVIALALQVMVTVLPAPTTTAPRLALVLGGIAVIGIGSGLYLTTNLGPGPRDGWMTGVHLRTGWPISAVRLGIEATVVVAGWLLGGTVGVGTVLFALLVGPAVGYGLAGGGGDRRSRRVGAAGRRPPRGRPRGVSRREPRGCPGPRGVVTSGSGVGASRRHDATGRRRRGVRRRHDAGPCGWPSTPGRPTERPRAAGHR